MSMIELIPHWYWILALVYIIIGYGFYEAIVEDITEVSPVTTVWIMILAQTLWMPAAVYVVAAHFWAWKTP